MRWHEFANEATTSEPSALQKYNVDRAANRVTALIQSQAPGNNQQELVTLMTEWLRNPKIFNKSYEELVDRLCEYLDLQNTVEQSTKPSRIKVKPKTPLQDALEDFTSGYEKDDAYNISHSRAQLEDQIIKLFNQSPISFSSNTKLYRGTAVSDDDYAQLVAGHTIQFQLKPSGKLVSWSTKRNVAKQFANDSWNGGESNSVVVIQQLASTFDLVIPAFKAIENNGEFEVLTNNCVISIGPHNIVDHKAYNGD